VQSTAQPMLCMPSPLGEFIQVETHGVEMRIIDYTLSRMKAQKQASTKKFSQQPDHLLFSDLDKDPDLFNGLSTISYQYDIYRQMKELVQKKYQATTDKTKSATVSTATSLRRPHVFDHAAALDECIWMTYCPTTNALWLWYCLKFILIPKLNSPLFRKISTLKRTLTTLAVSLHQQVIVQEGTATLEEWYLDNKCHFVDFSCL
jgi:Haspin like kinase domain